MKRWLYLASLALPLAGCVLPPAVGIASLAVDIGSYAATGKTSADHVISGVSGQDCRVVGLLEGRICEEEREFETAVASLEPLQPLPGQALPVLAPLASPMTLQLAMAEEDTDVSPLAGLGYLSAGPIQAAEVEEDRRAIEENAGQAVAEANTPLPGARQLAALTPVPEEEPVDTRGLVYGEDGHVLGVSYAFQNPLAYMDGNRESLNGLALLDP